MKDGALKTDLGKTSTRFPHLREKNWYEPILWEDNLWFSSFVGGKSGRRVKWWENNYLVVLLNCGRSFFR